MNALYLGVMLFCASPEVPDGTLIFLENSNRFVEFYTDAKITHVGVVLNVDSQPRVYEATPGKVRLVPLAQYYDEIGALNPNRSRKIRIWLVAPRDAYSEKQVLAMRTYLDSQLDRRYSVKSFVRKQNGDGVHCAELTATTLESTGNFEFGECYDESPQSVFDKVKSRHQVMREFEPDAAPTDETWCERSRKWWGDFYSWCCWSCYEGWTFCR